LPYQFQPWVSDADGDALTFKIRSRPSWASFDSRIGRLTGQPSSSDVGTYNNIVIAVSDGKATVLLPAFSITVQPSAALVNSAPTISGPPAGAFRGAPPYDFHPPASDPDGAPLSFSVKKKPIWAGFSSTTGRL